jgi:putative peptide zinc metalloprotease protein
LVGYVVRHEAPVIRVAVPESEVDLVLQGTRGIALRTASRGQEVLAARIERIGPQLEETLPNPALGTQGGGSIALDPTDPAHQRTIGKFLHIDLALVEERRDAPRFGERVHVRFVHAAEPVASRLYRGLRQVFLKHFSV